MCPDISKEHLFLLNLSPAISWKLNIYPILNILPHIPATSYCQTQSTALLGHLVIWHLCSDEVWELSGSSLWFPQSRHHAK